MVPIATEMVQDDFFLADQRLRQDSSLAQVVFDAGRSVLALACNLATGGFLQNAPHRVYTRILFAATLLLKVSYIYQSLFNTISVT